MKHSKIVLLLFVVLSVSLSAHAQQYSGQMPSLLLPDDGTSPDGKSLVCSHALNFQSAMLNRPDGSAIVRRPYDVLKYDLFMDWRNPLLAVSADGDARKYSGINTITLRMDSANITKLTFNGISIRIDSIFRISKPENSKVHIKNTLIHQPIDGEWSVDLTTAPQIGDTVILSVYYTHIGTDNRGFLLYEKNLYVGLTKNKDSVFLPERLAYTMSEPQDARIWMPCNDAPYDKAIATITVRVPYTPIPTETNFTVSSNGLRTIGSPQFDVSTLTMYRDFIWRDDTPIPTYLMVVNASKFKEYSQWYKRVTNTNDSVEIMNYIWQKDYDNEATDGSQYNARFAFRNVPSMMEHYSKLYGEYPFVKYGHTAAQPFAYGGMEHQTMTTVNRVWLYGGSESSIAHELMHQWTGDLTTCATWGDIWLNEGGATYGEALFYESWGGDEWYGKMMNSKRDGYLQKQPQPPIYGIPLSNVFNYATTYCKGGWVYAMLRKTYGDSTFFRTMRTYFDEFRYKSAETEDLLRVFDREIPNPIIPFRTFFDQWLYSAGHPVYELQTKQTYNGGNNREITITLSQTQTGNDVPEVFVMPVKITLVGKDNNRKVVSFINNKRVQTETFYTDFVIDSAIVDEHNEILCEKVNLLTSVKEVELQVQNAVVLPQPAKRGESAEFRFSNPTTEPISISIISMVGQTVVSLQEGMLSAGAYSLRIPTEHLASGMYSIRMTSGNQTHNYPFVVIQ
ncbi:MAG: T9SS type A sorting domain-containing protein [Bacteroidetes bacterium]|nr:T9SS type A sorting domain-containing protein [Bacteroidota bacterium]